MSNIHSFIPLENERERNAPTILTPNNSNTNMSNHQEQSFFKKICPKGRLYSATNILALVMIIIFLLCNGWYYYKKFNDTEENWTCILYNLGGKYTPSIVYSYEIFRLFNPMFLHANLAHIFMNSLILLMLGYQLEKYLKWNKLKFLTVYFISGLSGNMLSSLCALDGLSVGASGANMESLELCCSTTL